MTFSNVETLDIDGIISQLEFWAYEVYDAKLTFAEKLEKRKWECGNGGD